MPQAITYASYGGPEVLQLSHVEMPEPGPGQVRIKVSAAAINPYDLKARSGRRGAGADLDHPVIPGLDAAGTVDALGDGVSDLQVGDEVFGPAHGGAYAEYAVLRRAFPRPDKLSAATAAALVTPGSTASRVLDELGVRTGQTLLIHGAAGAVGILATQLAVQRGAAVIGTVNPTDFDLIARAGGVAVAYGDGWMARVGAAAPAEVDLVLDTSGAGVLADSVALTGSADRVITIADSSAAELGVRFSSGAGGGGFEVLPGLAEGVVSKRVIFPAPIEYPLTEAAQVQAEMESGDLRDKVVLVP